MKETLIDPESRDACGRRVIEPGTDVKQCRKNALYDGGAQQGAAETTSGADR